MIFAHRETHNSMIVYASAPREKLGRYFASAVLLAAGIATGCHRNHPPPISETAASADATPGGVPLLTERKLDPLTQSDVELYLKVMRAAAARVQNPTPDDLATLAQARQIMTAADAGKVPSSSDARTLERASQIGTEMDQIVADEQHVDAATYLGIARAIEAVVPDPRMASSGENSQRASAEPGTPLERRMAEADAANRIFLAPYREEIERLIAIVRNPENLPKS